MTDRTNDSLGSAAADPYDGATPGGDLDDHAPRSARSSVGAVDERGRIVDGDTQSTAADVGADRRRREEDDIADLAVRDTDGRDHADSSSRADVDAEDLDADADGVDAPHERDQVSARSHVNGRESGLPATVPARRGDASYAVGPFSVREVALLGVWAVAFLVSFFPDNNVVGGARLLVGGTTVWLSGLWFIPAVALPTVAVGLIVLRRLSPQGIRRVGSLGIDQFASVAFSVAALVWVAWVWDTVVIAAETGGWVRSWVVWVEAVLLLAGVVLTVAAPFIRPFSADFAGREEIPAHRLARPIRPVVARPRLPRPRAPRPARRSTPGSNAPASRDSSTAPGSYTGSTELPHPSAAHPATSVLPTHGESTAATGADARGTDAHDSDTHDSGAHGAREHGTRSSGVEPSDAELYRAEPVEAGRHGEGPFDARSHAGSDKRAFAGDDHPTDVISSVHHDDPRHAQTSTSHAATQAFWALAPEEREVVDDYGTPIFRIGPSAWALVIEDRGETFVVRHDDGRIGYLHETAGVTRG